MKDSYGRTIDKLRVSLLDRCNLSCQYCVSEVGGHPTRPGRLNSQQFFQAISFLVEHAGITRIRFTGGEPLLYPDLVGLAEKVSHLNIHSLGITTNGHGLAKRAKLLVRVGLTQANISLDSVEEASFALMARQGRLVDILKGIEAAVKAGMTVKLNTVVMRGINDQQILPVLKYAHDLGVEVRFLELMQMGPLHQNDSFKKHFVGMNEILAAISQVHELKPLTAPVDATALRYQTETGTFGIIANSSAPFCQSCSRLRLSSQGKLIGCLSNAEESPFFEELERGASVPELRERIRQALRKKQPVRFLGSTLGMSAIGG